jgi:pimeloyl-ACP methyl ester carboxylesterase
MEIYSRMTHALTAALLMLFVSACAHSTACDPLPVDVVTSELLHDDKRRSQVDIYSPRSGGPYPLVAFSHGAFSAPERYAALLSAIAASGFVVVAPLHIDSELLTNGQEPPPRVETWSTRKADMRLVAEAVPAIEATLGGVKISAVDEGYLVAGHSYGAFIAQVLAGATGMGEDANVDKRIEAVIAFSPPGPLPGFIADDAWDGLSVPHLVVTGTADILPGFLDEWELHTLPYQRAEAGQQWLWVGKDVDHYFGKLIGRLSNDIAPQKDQFAEALAVTQQFALLHSERSGCAVKMVPAKKPLYTLTRR